MLRISQQANSGDAKRYYATADYYSEGQEVIGEWGGRGSRMLGLHGSVDKAAFERLCDNLDPAKGTQLTARHRADRTVLYDFTWSVPKSVSVLYALTGDEQLVEAFRSAVNDTMKDIEAEMLTRVRRGGKDENRCTGNMVWAEFIHKTSRPVNGVPDPQLHIHTAALNLTWDEKERQWKAGQFRELKRDAPYFQAAFHVRLAGKLQELGYGIERKRDGFQLAGIPASVVKKFSRRTEHIERIAAELGITNPQAKAELGAQTREKKNKQLTWNELQAEWRSRLTPNEGDALAKTHARAIPFAMALGDERPAVDYALAHSFAREAVVSERKLLTEALKRGVGSVTVEGAQRELASRPLIRAKQDGKTMATTDGVLAEENRVIAFGQQGRGKYRPYGNANTRLTREWLNKDQAAAVRHVLGSRDRVVLIRGAAGTGKTTLMQEAVERIQETGTRVVVLAPSVKASHDVLRGEGFAEADTVARFLKDKAMQERARHQLIWVDEAGLLGTEDMVKLFDVVGDLDARIVLCGDRHQHRGVARGEPLKLLEERAGLRAAEVTNIVRQTADYRQAVTDLSKGDIAAGFAKLDKLGWIKEVADAERYQQLAAAYLAAVNEKKSNGEPVTSLVVCPTHAEAGKISATIREGLKAQGKLGEEQRLPAWLPANLTAAEKSDPTQYAAGDMIEYKQNAPGIKKGKRIIVEEGTALPLKDADRFEVYRPGQQSVATGDRIRLTSGGRTKDGCHRLNNGALFTVKGFTRQGDPVLENGWVIAKEWGHLAAGYVVTSHASQGSTVDKVFIGQSSESLPASNRRQFYVSVSRGKKHATIFTDSKAELLQAVERADEPMAAIELAATSGRKEPLRQRLNKRLAFLRRSANLGQTNESRSPDPNRTPPLDRQYSHER